MSNIDHKSSSPNTIHTAVLPKPFLIDANINSAIKAMLDIMLGELDLTQFVPVLMIVSIR